MLYNLSAEMVQHAITVRDLKAVIGKSNRTVRDKLNGKTAI